MRILLVGGAVRDQLLNRPVKDHDWVVVGATEKQMLAKGFRPVGKDFPVFLHPKTNEEYALARIERKQAKGYHGFSFDSCHTVTLEEDLMRRDLTINAMAQDDNGKIYDYHGGQDDIKYKLLRHVSDSFTEDPVRILRVARFAARYAGLGFTVAKPTIKLMKKMVTNGEVNALVAERVWQETEKALTEPHPEVFFEVLRECGALKVLFPDIDRLFGVPQPPQWHPEVDTGIHTMMVLQQACRLSDNPIIRFAALTHDLGKGTTKKEILPSHHGHEERSYYLLIPLCEQYRIPKQYAQLAKLTARYHTHIHKAFELQPKTLLKVLESCDAFRQPDRFSALLTACKADTRGRTGFEERQYPQQKYYQKLADACAKVDTKAIISAGFKGIQIKEQLHQKRIKVIKQIAHEQRESGQTQRDL
ncbi:MAG: multifunctional CCA addition/repair protein [Thiotrichaceae bacterium]|nr:multifunctional CCA addition/repair protein [Thiotrichaceae bacterium]